MEGERGGGGGKREGEEDKNSCPMRVLALIGSVRTLTGPHRALKTSWNVARGEIVGFYSFPPIFQSDSVKPE